MKFILLLHLWAFFSHKQNGNIICSALPLLTSYFWSCEIRTYKVVQRIAIGDHWVVIGSTMCSDAVDWGPLGYLSSL